MKDRYSNIPSHLKEYIVSQNYNDYTQKDQACWRFIMDVSQSFFKDYAHDAYLDGLQGTGVSTNYIPRIEDMDKKLNEFDWRAVPVRGFLPPTIFMQFQAHSILPIASDMRTVNHINYTPAPDIVHEAAGHSPIIIDRKYSKFLKEYGECAANALSSNEDHEIYLSIRHLSDIKENPRASLDQIKSAEENLEQLINNITFISEAAYLARLNWWTVEYGLVGTLEKPQIYGAGLLSSVSESYNAIFGDVERIPLSLDCIKYSYDITEQQPQLFIAKDFDHLSDVLSEFRQQMAFQNGGIESIENAIKCKTVSTFTLDSGIQISGIPIKLLSDKKERYYMFSGPVQLSYDDLELDGHGGEYHSSGYSSPLINRNIINKLDRLAIGEEVKLQLDVDIKISGVINKKLKHDGKLLIVSLENCTVSNKSNILFDPSWGIFDLACGEFVNSVRGGPADIKNYHKYMNIELPNKDRPEYITNLSEEDKNLIKLYSDIHIFDNKNDVDDRQQLIELVDKVIESFPNEWLLFIEIYKIADNKNYIDLSKQIKNIILSINYENNDLFEIVKRRISQI
tara:strand:+ start:1197 stop:2897 length:1701 start_codon:yes stop_codon:yes gene_type:complete